MLKAHISGGTGIWIQNNTYILFLSNHYTFLVYHNLEYIINYAEPEKTVDTLN